MATIVMTIADTKLESSEAYLKNTISKLWAFFVKMRFYKYADADFFTHTKKQIPFFLNSNIFSFRIPEIKEIG